MTRNLYRVFASVRIGRTEEGDEHFIKHGTISADKMTEGGCTCFTLGKRRALYGAEMLTSDADGFGTADADDADGSALSGGYGADGIGRNHSLDYLKCKDTEEFFNSEFWPRIIVHLRGLLLSIREHLVERVVFAITFPTVYRQ